MPALWPDEVRRVNGNHTHPATRSIRLWLADNARHVVREDVRAFRRLLDELDHLLVAYEAKT